MKKCLVVGGAGYIGGVCVEKLIERGDQVVILDNLITGHRENIHKEAEFVEADKADREILRKIFSEHKIDAVLDFAGLIQVGESVKDPGKYFENNLGKGIVLLEEMVRAGVKKIIFSSTAAVYGNPERTPIEEEDAKMPINPYGESKLFFEQVIKRFHEAHGLNYTIFRYFNACGAYRERKENHTPESHLIPIAMEALSGKREYLSIFGDDYETPDGTCIRDYVHVSDLVNAHLSALDNQMTESGEYNLGSSHGYSVKEVVDAIEKVTGEKVPVKMIERRAGDPAILVASSEKAQKELSWIPEYDSIEKIIETII